MRIFPSERRTIRLPNGLVVASRPLDAHAPYLDAWRALGGTSLVENLFYEPDFALSAGQAFGAGVTLLMVADRPPEDPGLRLLALWPCRIAHRWGLPLPVLMGWTHAFSIFGAPLLDRSDPDLALDALLDAPRLLGLPRRLMLTHLPLDGPLAALLDAALARSRARRADFWAHDRGFLALSARGPAARADYLGTEISDRKSRQLARFWRRLEADGPVSFESLRAPHLLDAALDDYVALERAGWKGRIGTAIGQNPAELAFMRRLIGACGTRGRVRIDRLRRGGRSLAVSIGFETASEFWYLKIAHAEDESRNSPGAQLVLRVTRDLLADERLASADSCAPPGFAMIEGLWKDRRRLAHALVEAHGRDGLFALAVRLERLRAHAARLRRRAKGA